VLPSVVPHEHLQRDDHATRPTLSATANADAAGPSLSMRATDALDPERGRAGSQREPDCDAVLEYAERSERERHGRRIAANTIEASRRATDRTSATFRRRPSAIVSPSECAYTCATQKTTSPRRRRP
jgi:hypothetical protein